MDRRLKIALISTDYPPLKTSAAVQMKDLASEFRAQGHEPTVIVPLLNDDSPWKIETMEGVEVLRLSAPEPRAATHARRALAEARLPFAMLRNLRRSPMRATRWDVVAWYSPPISLGPLVWAMRRSSGCVAYLILRDIFPEWALDLGILRKGPAYQYFKALAALQYSVADVIGVQTPSNLGYLAKWARPFGRRVEVLHNWLVQTPDRGCSIVVANTALAGRKIFAYIGNMGLAQGMDIFVELAQSLNHREDIGFLFVGRGSEVPRLRAESRARGLSNMLFFDEIHSSEIPGLLTQCHVGMVALHPAHKTHNIPGKFVSYMQYGVPVLARVNPDTDLARLIEDNGVGRSYVGNSVDEFKRLAEELIDNDVLRDAMSEQGRQLGKRMFSPEVAARQIVASAS